MLVKAVSLGADGVNDVIGFALDMHTPGAAFVTVSVNGSFAIPNGLAFSAIDAPFLSPALSGNGNCRVNFGERPFEHLPPGPKFISVHASSRDKSDTDDSVSGSAHLTQSAAAETELSSTAAVADSLANAADIVGPSSSLL